MSTAAHFSVDTRLARLLGDGYRSSEVALKELVDNAWDAEAHNVWITLPEPMTVEPVVVRDDGLGMTSLEIRTEYLNIANDKRRRSGERTPTLNRRIKGRKGIGKFAGLMIAEVMHLVSYARGQKCSLSINKRALLDKSDDLEAVPLPFYEEVEDGKGTIITLSDLDNSLNFPTAEKLRAVLIYEYGREDSFRVYVNDIVLSVEDIPGTSQNAISSLPEAGDVSLQFTISDGKKQPKAPGILLKINGKSVGKPGFFGLDEDNEIPEGLRRRVYGEVNISGLSEDHVAADWGSVIENSKPYIEAREFIRNTIKKELQETYAREMNLQKARLQRQIDSRLQKLPEYRRSYALEAVNRILLKYYEESADRIATIADVALDAIEHDAYWQVLEQIGASSHGDVDSFASSLKQFGLLELSSIGAQATLRLQLLDYFDKLIEDRRTIERDVHKALESNLWILGRKYSSMSSNVTLGSIIEKYCDSKYKGDRASKRPDLLLSQDYGDSYLLIEFKRPSHDIDRDDIAQAEKYRDDLSSRLSSTARMDIMLIGKGRSVGVNTHYMAGNISIYSYASVISAARSELDWLVKSLNQ